MTGAVLLGWCTGLGGISRDYRGFAYVYLFMILSPCLYMLAVSYLCTWEGLQGTTVVSDGSFRREDVMYKLHSTGDFYVHNRKLYYMKMYRVL